MNPETLYNTFGHMRSEKAFTTVSGRWRMQFTLSAEAG